jgi:glutamyl-tRNA(Gln) amidotransferase subunit D
MAMEPEEIFASLPELFDEVSFDKVHSLFNLGSEDMYAKQWKVMAEESADALNEGSRGVVITHGTDTMGYSSAILSFMLPDLGAPVVLTGAQRSSDRGSYDGAMNLIAAARIAAKSDIASVMISMHGSSEDEYCNLSRGTKVRKMHTSRRDAFRTVNELPLARISRDGDITELHENLPRRHNRAVEPKTEFEEKVGLIKIHPGISPDILDYYVDKGTRGIILEGTGLGHFPTFPPAEENRSWSPAVERAIDEGVVMGMTSQCLYGRVHPFVYRALRTSYQLGVIYLQDMLPETAFIKLGWTLGNYSDEKEITEIMQTNLAGEISPISQYKEFMV